MIETITTLDRLRTQVAAWKQKGYRVAFVPTMGNLHAGHCALVQLAKQHADRVVVSIFVNPTQFGVNEDFSRYPRTPTEDVQSLDAKGCHAVWLPTVQTMSPFGVDHASTIHIPGLSVILEGAHRPGHFDGVCTVVARLFHQVQPDVAIFGKKDFQQLAVIRQMVADFAFPIDLLGAETVRERDGLALSSRNQYLSPIERAKASDIWHTLIFMRDAYQSGMSCAQIEQHACSHLQRAGFRVDYAVLRQPQLICLPAKGKGLEVVALIAAHLGSTRLIDNLEFESAC